MGRPVKWSRDVHAIRERAVRMKTETWSRQDIEHLFDIGRASAQSLMKAMGGVQTVGAAHFVERDALLTFLNNMIEADSVEAALRSKLAKAEPAPKPKPLRITLPEDLRHAMLPDLPANIKLSPGRIEVTAESATGMAEALLSLAMVMQNDLDRWQQAIEPPVPQEHVPDEDMREFLSRLRNAYASPPIQTPD